MERKKIILASNNDHKVKEIKNKLSDKNVDVISLKEAGIEIDVEETGATFIENAQIKADAIYKIVKEREMNCMVLADDSGLMVDALDGAPGVYSARFAGEHGNSQKNNEKLIQLLKGKKGDERSAKFVCAMVLIRDDNDIIKVQGEAKGFIKEEYQGEGGFGYDPLFFFPECNMTFAEMSEEQKNSVSHRGRALDKLNKELNFTR